MYNFDDLLPPKKIVVPAPPTSGFIGSYPPVAKPGENDGFFINTYFLQPDRKSELAGPVPVRSNKGCN